MPEPCDHVERVYGFLIVRFADSMRDGLTMESVKLKRLWDVIKYFEELWPEETKRWRDRHDEAKRA